MLLFLGNHLQAQVTSVNYQMKFDTATCLYDCYVIINSGSAVTQQERTQFNAQYSIIVPTGIGLSLTQSYFPLVDNTNLDGTVPSNWVISAPTVAPAAQPGSDFYSITPSLAPTSRYNVLNSGDTVKVFSLQLDSTFSCAEGIRIYENGVDPTSSDIGMNNLDYSNGFTIGNTLQRYNENSTQVYPPKPVIVSAIVECSDGIEIDLTAYTPACQLPLTYSWTGPAGYTSTTEDVSIPLTTNINNGDYTVTVTDAYGCMTEITIEATSKPDAGLDKTMCAGTMDTLIGVPSTGTWEIGSNNSFVTLQSVGPGKAIVTFGDFANIGGVTPLDYDFYYSIPGCADTMIVSVNPQPNAAVIGDGDICLEENEFLFPSFGGTWISNHPSIATVTSPGGVISPVSAGTATFTFTDAVTGCENTVGPITVNPAPTVSNLGSDTLCVATTTNLNPSTGGEWVSTDTNVFTVDNSGNVMAVAPGRAAALYTSDATTCVSDSLFITVVPKPVTQVLDDSICVYMTTQLLPSTGGTWTSSNPIVASITNDGLVTGKAVGDAVFTYTQTASSCVSPVSDTVWVTPAPVIGALPSDELCTLENMTLSPTTGGTWTSSDPAVASVTLAGVVTTKTGGNVVFTFEATATGCSAPTETLLVHPNPTASTDRDTICIDDMAALTPATGGTWVAVYPGLATISGSTVTGVAEGNAAFLFTSDATGCTSDTMFIEVEARPITTLPTNIICALETLQLQPSSGGTWESSNPAVATIDNNGLVTGLTSGAAFFTYTSSSSGCKSDPTNPLIIIPIPVVTISGPTGLCIGETSMAAPAGGGTWASSDPLIADIHANTGVITAISPGTVTFTFTTFATGCESAPTEPLTVFEVPEVNWVGPPTLCVGTSTTVFPNSGGIWYSDDETVATVDNQGNVTAIGNGTANLTFKLTATDCFSAALVVTVSPTPDVEVTGSTVLCIGATTDLSPTTGGTWTSSNESILTVTNSGHVIAIAQGQATFTFVSDLGCGSSDSEPVIVNGGPTSIITDFELCIGETTNATTSSLNAGIWTSSMPAVADIDNNGLITAYSEGTATFKFEDSVTGCTSDASALLTVQPQIVPTLGGADSICIGENTQFFPSVDGSWSSSNESVATIENNGQVTATGTGRVVFTYTPVSNNCPSVPTDSITVTPGPDVTVPLDNEICVDETLQLMPSTGGTWESLNEVVASVTPTGLVTGVSGGQATFQFTEDATGCKSDISDPVIVHNPPVVFIDGTDILCLGGTTQLSPSTGGVWTPTDPSIASVDANGEVTALAFGTTTFRFTEGVNGCVSEETLPITVKDSPPANVTGETEVCIGAKTTLEPTEGGEWVSNNPSIAIVNNSGVVTAMAPGEVTFTFTEAASGCSSESTTGILTVSSCLDPDFNVTYVDVPVPGDVSTNDATPGSPALTLAYGIAPLNTGKPTGALYTLTMGTDGVYEFVGNMIGVYTFEVEVCVEPLTQGCQFTTLTITVVDFANPDNAPIANLDLATTPINTDVEIPTLANDRCVITTGCSLDPASVTIIENPNHGTVTVDAATGNTTYSPTAGYIGVDTLLYQVCVTGDLSNCAQAYQVIIISDSTAPNSTVAADDFNITNEGIPATGDVDINDSDPEGDNQTVNGYTSTVPAGTLVLNNDGTYVFTPAHEYYGPVDFPYTICDDNANQACADATLHILVMRDLTIFVRVYLEGSIMNNNGEIGTTHTRPLMRDNLRDSPFNNVSHPSGVYIPGKDPYTYLIGDNIMVSHFTHVGPYVNNVAGKMVPTDYATIDDSLAVYSVEGEDAIVDWVFVELRSKHDSLTVVATRSGIVQRDGDVAEIDGDFGLRFPGVAVDDYYVVVRHRNHLGAMTGLPQTPNQLFDLVDFTVETTPIYDFGTGFNALYDYTGLAQQKGTLDNGLPLGYQFLWGGNLSHDDVGGRQLIKYNNPNDDLNSILTDVSGYEVKDASGNIIDYNYYTNFDFAYGYNPGDFDMNSKTKVDNPGDDVNWLYGQLLFYPLNVAFTDNFDHFTEQLPFD